MTMRRFVLQRDTDVSGISGTGLVAEGVEFTDGHAVVRWCGERQSTVVWSTIADVEAIHGHGGATQIVWVDEPHVDQADADNRDLTDPNGPHPAVLVTNAGLVKP